jgi:hypothetical protein
MLIPDIASAEKWKMFFQGDIGRALGYCERVLGLYNNIRMRLGDEKVKKIVVGVIGKDTIGHWRDIQEVFREFFGVKCVRCEEVVRSIAMGVPYSVALKNASLRLEDSSYIRNVEELAILLSKVHRESNIYLEKSDNLKELERDFSALLNNPLNIVEIVRGFYSSLKYLLPLYNRFTFFITISKYITRNLLEKYFKDLDLKLLSKFNIRFREDKLCKNIDILTHEKGSIGEAIVFLVNSIYRFFDRSRGMRRIIGVKDEEERFVKEMLKLVTVIYQDLELVENTALYSSLYRSAVRTLAKGGYIYISVRVRIDQERNVAIIHNYTTSCENLVNIIEPYMITGLASIDNVAIHGNKIELLLNIYLNQRSVKA